jgi:hypothetical protein
MEDISMEEIRQNQQKKKNLGDKQMIYSEKALQNIIIENIKNKKIVRLASSLYTKGAWNEDYKEMETQLTGLLLSKQYELPRPEPSKAKEGK